VSKECLFLAIARSAFSLESKFSQDQLHGWAWRSIQYGWTWRWTRAIFPWYRIWRT